MSRTLAPLILFVFCACSASVEELPLEREGYVIDACDVANAPSLANLQPGTPVDYLELRMGLGGTERHGERCGGATDVAACEMALGNASGSSLGWQTRPGGGAPAPSNYIVYSRGDEVGIVGAGEVNAFLAPIDNVAEAIFLAQIATLGSVTCELPDAKAVDGTFEVITRTHYTCGGGTDESRVRVDADGRAEVLERVVISAGVEEICP